MEICLVGAALIHVDGRMGGQMDGYDEAFHDVQTHLKMHEWD
jgi:hypothetical protein